MRPQSLPDGELNGGPGQRVVRQTKITLGKGVAGPLDSNVGIRPDPYGTRFNEVPLKAWKQLAERMLSANQQAMRVSGLWRARPVNRPIAKRVAFKHDDLLKMIRQGPGRSQPRDPGANDDGLACNCLGSHGHQLRQTSP